MLWLQVTDASYMQADQAVADNELEHDNFWEKVGRYVPCSPSAAVTACKGLQCGPAVRPSCQLATLTVMCAALVPSRLRLFLLLQSGIPCHWQKRLFGQAAVQHVQ